MMSIGGLLKRLGEIGIGLLALVIAGLTLWACYDILVHRPDTDLSTVTLWAITYLLGFLAVALALFGARLIVAKLRVQGGHIIGLRGVVAFTALYGVLIVLSIVAGPVTIARLIPAALLLFAGATLIRDRLRARSEQ